MTASERRKEILEVLSLRSGFTAIHNHSGGKLRRLHGKANPARKYDFGGAV